MYSKYFEDVSIRNNDEWSVLGLHRDAIYSMECYTTIAYNKPNCNENTGTS